MSTERWRRLREMVEHALGLPEGERDGWLEAASGGDADLQREARALLEAAVAEDDFLAPPQRPRAGEPAPGEHVGPYRLVRRLATGGMGTVYEAEREAPRRRVALKLMRTALADADAGARFRYEVEVLASLTHPHIAHMYDTGVVRWDGLEVPWFAMEYVEGARPIVDYAREEGLGPRERVALFAEVCDAVHHGHAAGVLHRDLKPENILVDRRGVAKIIDFGVARATDADLELTTLRTTTGEIVGTLAYMSPEQVAGDRAAVGTRSDVYALGVVLYELLTGNLPYPVRGSGTFEAMRAIRETPPARPGPALRGDLETILMKCLAKGPERRYGAASGLADDLRHYLAKEPIAAHPPSLTYQVRVFTRRHRVLVAALATVLLVSVGAAVVSATFAVRAGRSKRAALEERDRARKLARALLERSLAAANRHAARVSRLPGGGPTALAMTSDALADLQYLESLGDASPEVRRRIAESYLRLGGLRGDPTVTASLGDKAAAVEAYDRAWRIARDLLAERPGDPAVACVAGSALVSLAGIHAGPDDLTMGPELHEGVAILQNLHRRDEQGEAFPEGVALNVVQQLARAENLLAFAAQKDDPATAARHAALQLEYRTEVARRWPGTEWAAFEVASAHASVAGAHGALGDYDAAIEEYTAAAACFAKLHEEEPLNVVLRDQLGWCELQLARCHEFLDRVPEALDHATRARDLFARIADETKGPQPRQKYLLACWQSGDLAARLAERVPDGRPLLEQAREAYADALEACTALIREGHLPEGNDAPLRELHASISARLDRE